jgi:peptidoglycan/LPS O-acetylase OafA/YrhL
MATLFAVIFSLAMIGVYLGSQPIHNALFLGLMAYAGLFVGLAALADRLKLQSAWLSEIGRRSFSMYVVHFLFMNMIDYIFNHGVKLLTESPNLKALLHYGVAVFVTYLVAGLTKRWIEDPGIHWGAFLIKQNYKSVL